MDKADDAVDPDRKLNPALSDTETESRHDSKTGEIVEESVSFVAHKKSDEIPGSNLPPYLRAQLASIASSSSAPTTRRSASDETPGSNLPPYLRQQLASIASSSSAPTTRRSTTMPPTPTQRWDSIRPSTLDNYSDSRRPSTFSDTAPLRPKILPKTLTPSTPAEIASVCPPAPARWAEEDRERAKRPFRQKFKDWFTRQQDYDEDVYGTRALHYHEGPTTKVDLKRTFSEYASVASKHENGAENRPLGDKEQCDVGIDNNLECEWLGTKKTSHPRLWCHKFRTSSHLYPVALISGLVLVCDRIMTRIR